MKIGKLTLPDDHRPGMKVPKGGSCCANCRYYNPEGGGENGGCASLDYKRYYGTHEIPYPPDEFCSDWYEPGERQSDDKVP